MHSLFLRGFSFVLLTFGATIGGPALAADLVWEPAPRSDDFVESIGVCTHWTYENTRYVKSYPLMKQLLAESGIRHVRDGLCLRNEELWRDLGVRTTIVSEPRDHDLGTFMTAWKADPGALDMIEGPNEPNNFWRIFNCRYKNEPWPEGVKLWQDELYHAVRAEPLLAGVPVTSPTPILDGGAELVPLRSFDVIAFHPYADGLMPSAAVGWSGQRTCRALAFLGSGDEAKPLVATEAGYHNCLSEHRVPAGGTPGISERAGGRYLPRMFAENWNAGIVRTFSYEWVDESVNPNDPEANFGLLREDGSPKPAFTAIANLISVLSESHWDSAALRWVRPNAPDRAFPLAIKGPPDVHHTVLSRADGGIDLLLWREVASFDLDAHKDLAPEPESVSVHLAAPVRATLYRPLVGTSAQKSWGPSDAIVVAVPDEVVVLRLAASQVKGVPPAAPVGLAVSTTATSATLYWRTAGPLPTAFIVSRLEHYLGNVVPSTDGTAAFTDAMLLPGMGFPYAVRAVDSSGLLSPAAVTIARTVDNRPDLVVESISWDPPHPQAGDEIHFTGTIANIGAAATPGGVTHGLTFSVNDKTVCWSDASHDPLAPGAKRILTANNGPNNTATWTCTAGTFTVKAIVDDFGRIVESNKNNNTLAEPLTVASRPSP